MAFELALPALERERSSDETLAATMQRDPTSPAAGDAFAELYTRYTPVVVGYVAGRFPALPAVGSEDVAQISLLAAWQNIHTFDPDRGSFRSWLIKIGHNTAVDAYYRRQGKHTIAVDPSDMPEIIEPDFADGVIASITFREMLATIKQGLSSNYLQILFDRMLDTTNAVSATRDGVAIGTLKGRVGLARRRAKDVLEKSGIVDYSQSQQQVNKD